VKAMPKNISKRAVFILNNVLECVRTLAAKSSSPNSRPASLKEYSPRHSQPKPMRREINPMCAVVFEFLLAISYTVYRTPRNVKAAAENNVNPNRIRETHFLVSSIPRATINSLHIQWGSFLDWCILCFWTFRFVCTVGSEEIES